MRVVNPYLLLFHILFSAAAVTKVLQILSNLLPFRTIFIHLTTRPSINPSIHPSIHVLPGLIRGKCYQLQYICVNDNRPS